VVRLVVQSGCSAKYAAITTYARFRQVRDRLGVSLWRGSCAGGRVVRQTAELERRLIALEERRIGRWASITRRDRRVAELELAALRRIALRVYATKAEADTRPPPTNTVPIMGVPRMPEVDCDRPGRRWTRLSGKERNLRRASLGIRCMRVESE
jgi:hypothetical protein